jgi:hypothetical protein
MVLVWIILQRIKDWRNQKYPSINQFYAWAVVM